MSLRTAFETPETKRRHVRRLFATIADRYDFITVMLSFGQDARWKARLVSMAQVTSGDCALDLACGTGDLAFGLAARGARTVGLDLTPRMVEIANRKQVIPSTTVPAWRTPSGRPVSLPVCFLVGDMGALPFTPATFDVVTTGYGLRNVPDIATAIAEIARVLRPGGQLLSLDFNRPRPAAVRALYLAYLIVVGSILGWALHGDPDTYRYIPESIRRYPGADGVAALLSAGGFTGVRVLPVLGGLMTLHLARLPR